MDTELLLEELGVAAVSLSGVSIPALLPPLSPLSQGWLQKAQNEVALGGRGTPRGRGGGLAGHAGLCAYVCKAHAPMSLPRKFFFKASIVAVGT